MEQVELRDPADTTVPMRLSRWAWLPIPLLLSLIVGLWVANLQTAYESRGAMVLLNVVFTWLASLCVCFLTARSFLASGQPGLLMFGCGSLLWGTTSLAAAIVVNRLNPTITIHNLGVFMAALCHLAGVSWRGQLRRRWPWLLLGYAGALAVAAGIIWAALAELTPLFFVQGNGGTLIRQIVLLLAVAMFAWVAWQMIHKFRPQSGTYYSWYGLGLALTATGLAGVMLLTVQGGILGWVNRVTQYIGCIYLLIAALTAARQSGTQALSLAAVDDALQKYWQLADEQRRQSWRCSMRYGLALAAVAGWGLRLALTAWVGPGLPTYITFYPAVMAVALLGGLGPGLLATALTCLIVDYQFLPPVGQFHINSPIDRVGLALFATMGLFMSLVAEFYRRNRNKAAAYDRVAALRESEQRFQALAAATFEGIAIAEGGRFTDVNEQLLNMLGYRREELIGREVLSLFLPEDRERIGGIIRAGGESTVEHQLVRKDGTRIFVEAHGRTTEYQNRKVRFTAIRDITERKRAEEMLRKQAQDALLLSAQEFHALAESVPQIVWATRADGWNIYFNQQWMDYTGMTLEESYGHGWNKPFHPDDQQRAWEAWQRATQYRERYSLECRLRRADGTYRWWLVRGEPMFGPDGAIHKWFGTCTDIDDIKRAEAALREANDLLELRVSERTAALSDSQQRERERAEELAVLLEAVPIAIFISHDTECLHMTGNRLADEILRIPHGNELSRSAAEPLRPMHFRTLKDGRELRLDELPAQRAARGEQIKDFEFTLAFDDGLTRQVLGYGTPLLDAAGQPRGMVAALVDITQRKRMELRLRRFYETDLYAILYWKIDGGVVDVNDKFLEFTGYTREDLRAGRLNWAEITPPEYQAMDEDARRQIRETGVHLPYEKEYVRKDGVRVWGLFSAVAYEDNRNEGISFILDITQRKRAQDAVRRSETLLRAITDNTLDPIFLKDRDSRLLLANPATLAALQRRADQVIGKTDEEFYDDPAMGRRMMANDQRVLASGQTETMEEIVPGPSGPRTFLSAKTPYRDADGRIIGIIGIARDITERKLAEDALRRSEERYRTMFTSMLEGFCIIEVIFDAANHPIDYRFLEVNPAFEAQTGMKDAAGKRMREFAPNHEEHWFELYGKIALTGEPLRFVNEAKALNRYYDVSAFKVGGPESRKVAILFSDISDAKRAEAALRASEERFRTVFETMTEGLSLNEIILDDAGKPCDLRYLMVNPGFERHTGLKGADIVGHTALELFHSAEKIWFENYGQVVLTGEPAHFEGPFGALGKWFEVSAFKTGERQLAVVFMDVTARKLADEQIRLHAMVLEAAANGIVIAAPDGTIQWVNPAFTRLTGYSAAEAIGQNPRVLNSHTHDAAFFKNMWDTVLAGQVWHGELVNKRKDGSLYSEEMTITPVMDAGGRLTHFIAIKQDVTQRKQAEEAIRYNQQRMEEFTRGVNGGLWEATVTGLPGWDDPTVTEPYAPAIFEWDIRMINEAGFRRLLDLPAVNGQLRMHDLFMAPPAERWQLDRNARLALQGGLPGYQQEFSRRDRHGQLKHLHEVVSIHPLRPGQWRLYGVVTDITERKQAEEALQQSQQLLKLITDAAPALISYIGVDGRYQMANAAYQQWLAIDPEGMLGRLANEVVGAAAWRKVKSYVDRALAGETVVYEMEMSYAGTVPRWFHTTYTPDRDEAGQVRGFVVLALDITERKRAEQAQLLLAAIVESTDDAIIAKSLDGTILSWNAAAQRLFGYTAAEIVGKPIARLLPPERVPEEERIAARLRRGKRSELVETEVLAKDGRRIEVSITSSPLKTSDGQVVGASKIIHDITARKQAEQAIKRTAAELARSNKDLAQFADVASHDLQEPLRMVTGYMQLIEKRYKAKLEPEALEFFNFAIDGATRMSRLIIDLLDYSRVNTRGKPLEPVEMEDILQRALDNLRAVIDESGAQISHDPLPTVRGDGSQLTQVFQNLIGNAIKFRVKDRPIQICIAAEKKDDEWVFSVKDNGIGIEAQYAEKIFLIFQRLHSRAEYPGTGIGLAICKRIVERHGGRIWVQSVPGQGSTFYFTISNPGMAR